MANIGKEIDLFRKNMPVLPKDPSNPEGEKREANTGEAIASIGTILAIAGRKFAEKVAEKSITAMNDAKIANKLGVFASWSEAETDKAAREILDKAAGVVRHEPKKKTEFERFCAFIDKADSATFAKVQLVVAAKAAKVGTPS